MREKQIEELAQAIAHSCIGLVESSCGEGYCVDCLATRLYKEGVTIQKWIPVTERLPTREDADETESIVAIHKDEGEAGIWSWDIVCIHHSAFTHWMPLPEAPKGE